MRFSPKMTRKVGISMTVIHNAHLLLLKRLLKAKYNASSLQKSFRCHILFGHPGIYRLNQLLQNECKEKAIPNSNYCIGCLKGKQSRPSFKHVLTSLYPRATNPLQRSYIDISGKIAPMSRAHDTKVMIITDGHSKFKWYIFDTKKTKFSKQIVTFLKKLQNEFVTYKIEHVNYVIR